MLIGIGLTVGWQFRISTPESFGTNGTIESSYDVFIESLIKSGEFVQSHEYYSSDREKAQAYIHILSSLIGSTKQEGKRNHNGQLKLVHGNKQFLSSCMMPIKPKVGDFYIFPHYLMHLVYPFVGNEERRSISFNAKIDEDIFDVFKN